MLSNKIHKTIVSARIIAVVVIDKAEHAVPLARALLKGGISVIELTLRTPSALEALKTIAEAVPELVVGAGTVLTPDQADAAKAAGARFAVAPGLNRRVVEHADAIGLPFAPGIMTPSDIETALELNCHTLKLFPAESIGGIDALKSMAAPYQHLGLDFIPLGGLNESNMASYLKSPLVSAIGGSWIAKRDAILSEDWNGIEASARRATNISQNL